jgi:hypothetical protein
LGDFTVAANQSSAGRGDFSVVLSRLNVGVSAIALFLITGYAPFAIAVLLNKGHRIDDVPVGFIVSAVFLSMAIGTFFSCYRTKTGLIVGPAVGLVSFVSQTSTQTIGTGQLVTASFIAACFAVFLSMKKVTRRTQATPPAEERVSLRREFLDNIPEPVKIGVRGGIGSLLAAAAIHGLADVEHDANSFYSLARGLFVAGTIVLLLTEVLQEKFERRDPASRSLPMKFGILALRLIGALLPLIWLVVLYAHEAFHLPTVRYALQLPQSFPPFSPFDTTGMSGPPLVIGMITFCFAVVILFVFLIDIPGSPYDFLKEKVGEPDDPEQIVDKSFAVTSIMSLLNPLLGLYTSVYYAENHAIVRRDDDSTAAASPTAGIICGVLFLFLAAGFLFADLRVDDLKLWILVALAPTLFTIGVRMTARALRKESEEGKVPSYYYVPAALTLLLTHFIGFEIALPIGVIYYGAYRWASGGEQPDPQKLATMTEERKKIAQDRQKLATILFWVLFGLSVLIVLALGAIKLGYG